MVGSTNKPDNTSSSSNSSSSHAAAVSIRDDFGPPAWAPQPLVNFARSTEFFARVAHIYGAYKLTQLRAAAMRAQVCVECRVVFLFFLPPAASKDVSACLCLHACHT
jgi:hypothetical protein